MAVRAFLLRTHDKTEALAERFRGSETGRRFDLRVVGLCVIASVSLCGLYYIGNAVVMIAALRSFGAVNAANALQDFLNGALEPSLAIPCWWALTAILFYFVAPAIWIRCVWRQPLSHFGLKWGNTYKDLRIGLWLCAVILPLVALMSATAPFQSTYPLYKIPHDIPVFPRFFAWEALYVTQLFALEFFFRGFLLNGLKYRFGYYSIFVSMIPYTMIHYTRPAPETLAAILAGVMFVHLSLESDSILLGALVHACIALTMDVSVLLQKGI